MKTEAFSPHTHPTPSETILSTTPLGPVYIVCGTLGTMVSPTSAPEQVREGVGKFTEQSMSLQPTTWAHLQPTTWVQVCQRDDGVEPLFIASLWSRSLLGNKV